MNKLYLKGKECLGKDMSPTESTFGCVQSLANVFKLAIGQELGESLSTTKLYLKLLTDKRFKEVFEPKKGDLIISPTGYGQGNGHTGIISDNNKIMSANSVTDKWSEHLNLQTWQTRYASFPILFFRYIIEEVKDVELEAKKISILQKIIELYKQIISKLLTNKLGSKYMEKSKLFRVNFGDVGRGALVAILSAVFLAFGSALNADNFSFATFNYAGLLQVAMASFMAYLVKNFATDSEGSILGSADKR